MKKNNVEMRVVCVFGSYGIHKCVVDNDGEIIRVGDNILAKSYASYGQLVQEIEGMLQNLTRSITHVNHCNKKEYGL